MPYDHYYPSADSHSNMILKPPTLLYTGSVREHPNWFNTPHSHDFLEILYMVEGSGEATVDGKTYPMQEGDIIILNANTVHAERFSPNTPANLIFLAVSSLKLENLPTCCMIASDVCPVVSLNKYKHKIESYFLDLISETSEHIGFFEIMSNSLLEALFVLILRVLISVDDNVKDGDDDCSKIREYIDRNYTSALTLEALSESMYISKSHLSHIFKAKTGISPIKYLIVKRIEKASDLIVNSNISISQIAEQVGYADPVYFSQIFKKTKGISPQQMRKQSYIK